jgi:hypothetical protein
MTRFDEKATSAGATFIKSFKEFKVRVGVAYMDGAVGAPAVRRPG